MLRDLYPQIDPLEQGMLDVGDGHRIYWEVSGNPRGTPVVFLHGGPGAGCTPDHRRFFDPDFYRIILFDQRGCGRSTPHAEIESNTTWHLVSDMEQLRAHFEIDTWMILGGSWGSALALAYAQMHPASTAAVILRGVFTLRSAELAWYYQDGASWVFPEYWDDFIAPIPMDERWNLIEAYRRRLVHHDRRVQLQAAKAWSLWEGRTIRLEPNEAVSADFEDPDFAMAFARIENHYFMHGGFFDEGQLIRDMHRLDGIPGAIVQGRYDMVTPCRTAWEVSRRWAGSELHVVDRAGHAADEPGIISALIEATDRFRSAFVTQTE